MRKLLCICICAMLLNKTKAQEEYSFLPDKTLKWTPVSLLTGSLALQGEWNLKNQHSFTAKIGLPLTLSPSVSYHQRSVALSIKTTSFLAGFRSYLSDRNISGFYLEPFFNYVNHNNKGTGNGYVLNERVDFDYDNHYESAGVGVQLGVQYLIKNRWVIDVYFLGPEFSTTSASFMAVETTNELPWNPEQAADVVRQARNVIRRLPFLNNKVELMVDNDKRTITGNYIGILPGIRTGISVGIAF